MKKFSRHARSMILTRTQQLETLLSDLLGAFDLLAKIESDMRVQELAIG